MRIAAVSDLHGNLPDIPQCDILIIAGDICPDRLPAGQWARHAPAIQAEWLAKDFTYWLNAQRGRYSQAYGCWGNHDFIGVEMERTLLGRDCTILTDEALTLDGFTFYFTPWTAQNDLRMRWAFMRDDAALERHYDAIPAGVDVLVSHSPAYGYGDDPGVPFLTNGGDVHLGSKSLLAAVARVKPSVLICGHIHGGYGKFEIGHTDPSPALDVTTVYNVALVNEAYKPVHPITVIDL